MPNIKKNITKKKTSASLHPEVVDLLDQLTVKHDRSSTYIIEQAIRLMAEKEGITPTKPIPKPKK